MKNNSLKKIIFFLFSIFLFVSCSDNIDFENQNKPNQDNFFTSAKDFEVGLNGCYSTMRDPISSEWMLTEMRSDNTFMTIYGTTNSVNLQMYNNDTFEAPVFDNYIESYWAATYKSIRSINVLAKALGVSYDKQAKAIVLESKVLPITDENRKNYAGEASFLRAYHNFNLVRLFGGVFLLDKVITPEEALKINRSTVEEMYDFILADLNNAVANCMTSKYSNASPTQGRINVWAAKALLAKVYLTLGRNAEATPLLADVINNSGYNLLTAGTTPYNDVFSVTNEYNSEILYAIRFRSGGLGYGSSLSNLFYPANHDISGLSRPSGTRGAFNNPTEELYNSYPKGDKRRDFTIKLYKPSSNAASNLWTYWSGKQNSTVTVANDSELDWPVLRFSDVLLMYCEAVGVNNATTLGYLNRVHTRAGLPALTAAEVDAKGFGFAVADERRWEFAIENQRWFDLLRFQKSMPSVNAKQVMRDHFTKMAVFYSQYNFPLTVPELHNRIDNPKFDLLPIPNSEIVTNTTIKIQQNPGY